MSPVPLDPTNSVALARIDDLHRQAAAARLAASTGNSRRRPRPSVGRLLGRLRLSSPTIQPQPCGC